MIRYILCVTRGFANSGILFSRHSVDWKVRFYPVPIAVFYKTTGAFNHHIVRDLENIEVTVVEK